MTCYGSVTYGVRAKVATLGSIWAQKDPTILSFKKPTNKLFWGNMNHLVHTKLQQQNPEDAPTGVYIY